MNNKKIAFLTYAEPNTGLGHWFRTLALEQEAKNQGYSTHFLTNRMLHREMYFQVRENNFDDIYNALHQIKPYAIVIDFQGNVPDYTYDITRKFGIKTVILNGVGRVEENNANLVVIQGLSETRNPNTVSGAKYVILRSKMGEISAKHNGNSWFVWGGARDRMGLLKMFNRVDDREATLVVHQEFIDPLIYRGITETHPNPLHLVTHVTGDAMLPIMANAKTACIAMGMAAWELAYLGTPTYAFSSTPGHLRFAKEMEIAGLLLAYPKVGLPNTVKQFCDFINQPITVQDENRPDLLGAQRVMNLIGKL